MNGRMIVLSCLALAAMQGMAVQAQTPSADEEERMDATLRKFGYVSGQAFQCHTKDEQVKLERTALKVGTNILRLFGSDRAFFFAAAFGAGASATMDAGKCPEAIAQADDMVRRLNVLASR